ncbi:MAG TPA: hypothetical protein VEW46_12150 [Pyrinomonadaceae bacterium]|nr:hypothetical protein [Pyrinomonadaceae bacterium]
MARFYRTIAFAFWVLGLLTTIAAVVSRITRPVRLMLEETVELRSLLWLAIVFFLGAIATRAIEQTSKD